MSKKRIKILKALIIIALSVPFLFVENVFAVIYPPKATLISDNLLLNSSAISIDTFYYNIYSLPGDSSVRIQFSKDKSNWYSSSGILSSWTDLNQLGGASIDLSSFNWSGDSFYYQIELNATSDLSQTPSIEEVHLNYTSLVGALTVDSRGNVGIGTNNPLKKLHVLGSSFISGFQQTARGMYTGDGIWFGSNNSVGIYKSSNDIRFRSILNGSTSDLVTISSIGNIGFGTINPVHKLTIDNIVSSGYAIDSGNQRIGNAADPLFDKDVVTFGMYNDYINDFSTGGPFSAWTINGVNLYNTNLSGNVGIGTRLPKSALDVNGSLVVTGRAGFGTFNLKDSVFKIAKSDGNIYDFYENKNFIANLDKGLLSAGRLQIKEAICGEYTVNGKGSDNQTYGTVLAKDGKCWLDRNLGAAQVATSVTDANAYGSYYQWGRESDGHQYKNSQTTSTASQVANPAHALFIRVSYNWYLVNDNNLWQGVNGVNNPCPEGFGLPTKLDWSSLLFAEDILGIDTAYSSSLKLTANGYRNRSGGYYNIGSYGEYWSSDFGPNGTSIPDTHASPIGLHPTYVSYINRPKVEGRAVRCVKD